MKNEKVLTSLMLIAGAAIIAVLAGAIIWKAEVIGVSESKVVEDARERQEIEDDWKVTKDCNEHMCAMLFYDEEAKECEYSVYLTREGTHSGYFFRHGGLDQYMAEDVKAMVYEGIGIAVMSMNEQEVCKIVTEERTIQVDPTTPFVVLLPIDCGEITLYDSAENIVTLYDTYTG